jgi:hypothetical protein
MMETLQTVMAAVQPARTKIRDVPPDRFAINRLVMAEAAEVRPAVMEEPGKKLQHYVLMVVIWEDIVLLAILLRYAEMEVRIPVKNVMTEIIPMVTDAAHPVKMKAHSAV